MMEQTHPILPRRIKAALCVLLAAFVLGFCRIPASAGFFGDSRSEWDSDDFDIDLTLLSGTDALSYDVQVTVENSGRDFEGVVRLFLDDSWNSSTAYDTVIGLPAGSTKQFTVRIPVNSLDSGSGGQIGTVNVFLIDRKNNEAAHRKFSRFLVQTQNLLPLGILSDSYSSLTWMDMGGKAFYFQGEDAPLGLIELKPGNLLDTLDTLKLLVIDSFDTSVLSEEEIDRIGGWVSDGGILLVGTGSWGDRTFSAFQNPPGWNSLELDSLTLLETMQPGDPESPVSASLLENLFYVDPSGLTLALFENRTGWLYDVYGTGCLSGGMGNGSVCIAPYSYAELGKLPPESYDVYGIDRAEFLYDIYDHAASDSNSRYESNYSSRDNMDYYVQRIFNVMSNSSSSLNLGILKVMLVIYVIFIGPVLYLILRKMKKMEIYWLVVPVSALFMILLVFLTGRGFEVSSTRVYSVTLSEASGREDQKAFMMCYDAGHREWDLKLTEDAKYAGPVFTRYSSFVNSNDYYYHIVREGETTSVGFRPSRGFENSYFQVSMQNPESGSIDLKNLTNYGNGSGVSGEITNRTGRDFLYVAVYLNNGLFVYKNLRDGESLDITNTPPFRQIIGAYNVGSEYLYDVMRDVYRKNYTENGPALAALGIGVCGALQDVDPSVTGIVIGVTAKYPGVIDDSCSELSYGCLYTKFRP